MRSPRDTGRRRGLNDAWRLTRVEAAVESLEGALAAERAGADRIELCVHLDSGGTTPGKTLIGAVVRGAHIPVFVLVRPRVGDFVYTGRGD